ncbi:hypothetical protein N7535_000807 [Penicillium sp. DV-2018c]|nr:hypothetical protein N7461_005948 [Penicillium sp. DV-2018c]KAJ5582187.1 hypothetical protein N7535_000807 [Penicillium sp. DV-2018c]
MMADIFGVPSEKFILKHKSPSPGWELGDRLRQQLVSKHTVDKPTLFIFFYAGHGTINQLNELSFTTTTNQKFVQWRTIDRELGYYTYPMDTF